MTIFILMLMFSDGTFTHQGFYKTQEACQLVANGENIEQKSKGFKSKNYCFEAKIVSPK